MLRICNSNRLRAHLLAALLLHSWLTGAQATAGTLAQFRTPLGELDVELFDADKPLTVRNFIRYVESGAYTNMFMHRWVPGFVIQGGGFRKANVDGSDRIEFIPTFNVISNEFNSGQVFSNGYGTLAMAQVGGVTDSATSQWFFNLANNAGLDQVDGGFTVFGRVIHGTNFLNRFNNVAQTNGIFRAQLDPPLNELPVLSATPTLNDLVYVNISLLTVRLHLNEQGERVISWRSVKDRQNHVEAKDGLDGGWQVVFTTAGTGQSIEYIDRRRVSAPQFYRVRVDYAP